MGSSLARYYRLLDRYLATLPAEQATTRLTLAELAAILGPATSGPPSSMPNWNAVDLARMYRRRAGFAAAFNRYDRAITLLGAKKPPRSVQHSTCGSLLLASPERAGVRLGRTPAPAAPWCAPRHPIQRVPWLKS